MSVKVYVEGGGDSKALKTACRKGFSTFIEKAGLAGSMPRIVARGSRKNAYDGFNTALVNEEGSPVLLVDAEGSVTANGPWQHLRQRDCWDRPVGATDDQCHLMVQVMESWFLADREALGGFYGQGYRPNALPSGQNVEQIPKQDVLYGLDQAARDTVKKGLQEGRPQLRDTGDAGPSEGSGTPRPMQTASSERSRVSERRAGPHFAPAVAVVGGFGAVL